MTTTTPSRSLPGVEILAAPQSSAAEQEVWWCFLLGLIGLLCAEVWMTRRMAMNR